MAVHEVDAAVHRLHQRCRRYFHIITVLVFGMLPHAGAQPSNVLGQAGSMFITEDEFLQRYEMMPAQNRTDRRSVEESKLALMYSLIAEKLLAQEGEQRGFQGQQGFTEGMTAVRGMLARDQLYRDEIRDKVTITPAEVDEGMRHAKRLLLLSFLYCTQRGDADILRSRIRDARHMMTMAIDSSMACMRDTATVEWGGAEEGIERAAFALQPGQVSPVVESGEGYYILTVRKSSPNPHYASMSMATRREFVESTIRARKEHDRLDEYTESFLKNQPSSVNVERLKLLVRAFHAAMEPEMKGGKVCFNGEMKDVVAQRCTGIWRDTLVTAGTTAWSVEDIVERLFLSSFCIDSAEYEKIALAINNTVSVWVWQEVLAQEGLRRNLDALPAVRRQLTMWYQRNLAEFMKAGIRITAEPGQAEVWTYAHSKDSSVPVPRVSVRLYTIASRALAREIAIELQQGGIFRNVLESRLGKGVTGGSNERFPIVERQPLGLMAWNMKPGEYSPAVQFNGATVMFEVLDQSPLRAIADSIYADRLAGAAADLRKMLGRRRVDLFLAQTAAERKYTIYSDRLKSLKVTTTPMMTYRLLGFGGRMFAVPPVERLIDWMGIEPPTVKIVP